MPEIIDTHQHLWDLNRFKLPWTVGHPVFDRSFLLSDYLDAAQGLNISKTIYMEVDMAPHQLLAEVEYAASLCQRKDTAMLAAVVSARPGEPGFGDYLSTIQTIPYIKGIRRVLHVPETPPGYCLNPAFIADIQRLAGPDMSYDIVIRADELTDAAKLIESCPEVRFILDHCGNADIVQFRSDHDARSRWREGIAAVAAQANVGCKISGFIWTVRDQSWGVDDVLSVIEPVYDSFGPKRVMFGGDWPVCTQSVSLKQWVEALQQAVSGRPKSEQRALFYDNAAAFYGLD